MKYSLEIDIAQPIEKVIELFDSFDNLKYWQEGYVSHEHLSGEPGQPGAKTSMFYKMGKREIEMLETIIERDLPDVFSATYEAKGVWNIISNHFEKMDDNNTKWRTENEFRFTTFFMKIMGFMMPGVFKKQSYKFLKDFKKFVEESK